jgi:hypothetical protein
VRPEEELDRQLSVLLDKGYPDLAGISDDDLRARVDALRPQVAHPHRTGQGVVNLLLVVRSRLVPTVAAVERFEVNGKAGWTDMGPELGDYRPIEAVRLPDCDVYLLVDVDTGAATLDMPPREALPTIVSAGRTPLTIDEGVALVTQFPSVFDEHNAFQALGSRTDNKRIPSFWVSKGAPRLGWCWEGNPHTWLGAASAAGRYGSG